MIRKVIYRSFKWFEKWLTPVELWKHHQMTLEVGDDIDVDEF